MPFKFNPFSGSFDQTGSGGGASYIDGEEATYNDLSLDAGVAPLNSAWLVRNSSGIWPFNKPGGIYIRTATLGASRDADYTYAGTMPDVFSDAVLTIYDEASTTRTGQFNLGSVTAGQNRVLTWPNANGTIARTQDFAAPPAIGSTTAAAANFTTVGATGAITGAEATVTSVRSLANGFQLPVAASSGAVGILSTFIGSGNELRIYSANSGGTISNMATFNASSGASFAALTATPAANTTALTSTGYSLTGSNAQSLIDLSGTWNTTGVPIAFKTNLTVTAAGSNSMYADFQAGGYSQFGVARISGTSNALWLYNLNSGTNTNGVGANYERGFLRWSSNVLQIGTEKLNTGGARALEFQTDGTTRVSITAGGQFRLAEGVGYQVNNRGVFTFTADGVAAIRDWNSTGAIFLRIGADSSTNLFPALKRSSTALQVRLADDSAFAPFACAGLTLNGDLTASTRNIVTDTTTGTKIGTGTTQKLGFFDKTPVVQPTAVADATDAATVITQLNALLSRMRDLGLIAT